LSFELLKKHKVEEVKDGAKGEVKDKIIIRP